MKIYLPWPPSKLSPNSRTYWRAKNPIKVAYREECYRIARNKQEQIKGDLFRVTITFHPPDRRSRDLDNVLASAKSGIDGVCMALGINDKQLRPITLDWGTVRRNGEIEICLNAP
jgi:crossover junction endodeoxyribonuclease RusA